MSAVTSGSPEGLRHLAAVRYVTALREGGSVPALVEADDDALYVVKFRAAAQGARPLAAELIVGELARAAGLRLPELALIEIDAALGRSEPHMEIQELLFRYSDYLDRQEWDQLAGVFTPDAQIDYSEMGGSKGNLEETMSFLKMAMPNFGSY